MDLIELWYLYNMSSGKRAMYQKELFLGDVLTGTDVEII